MLTVMHPPVGTMSVQIFNCEEFWYMDDHHTQWWIELGSSNECLSQGPAIILLFTFTVVMFVLGFPAGIFMYLRRARRYVRCRMSRDDAETHWEWMMHQGWTAFLDKADRPDFDNIFENGMDDDSSSGWSVSANPVMDMDGDHPTMLTTITSLYPMSPRIPLSDESRTHQLSSEGCDVYIKRDAIIKPEDSRASGEELHHLLNGHILQVTPITVAIGDKSATCHLRQYMKEDEGSHGIISYVPVTFLDNKTVVEVLGNFTKPFEDEFYFYQCYEIVRRLLQTGGVLVVEVLADRETAIVYAALVASVALCVHLHFKAFKRDEDDFMLFIILANQFLCQFFIMTLLINDATSTALGIVMICMQVGVVGFSLVVLRGDIRRLVAAKAQQFIAYFPSSRDADKNEMTAAEREGKKSGAGIDATDVPIWVF
ncbi:hypothetical protein CYMTET_34778 [Cymbomonas tetramitiformis]|uniref:Uncharacterized protein n=1 Tax=Cymbomonas tetramitiformis TaxID=36881 RepID=A0AAE0KPM1_9CHLO|nr:hypothetical protein CYMTET_34778 [Cymbomonas tetramitiformis]